MKKFVIALAKVLVSAALLGYLFYQAAHDDSFVQLRDQHKNWLLLAAAGVVGLAAVSSTFLRWYFLVRAQQIPIRLLDAFRLGFIGFLLNFFTLGVIGGDVLKAIFLGHEHPQRRVEAAASVVVDRAIGLFALFVVAAAAFWCLDFDALHARDPAKLDALRTIGYTATGVTLGGLLAAGIVLLPGFTTSAGWDALAHLPKVGKPLTRIVGAVRLYRRRAGLIAVALLMSLGTHALFTCCVFLIAQGLPGAYPSLGAHFAIVPIANLAGSVPLPGGLGAFELALDFLYRTISSTAVPERQGFVIALAFRIITILIALIGAGFYLTNRRQVDELMHEAETESSAAASADDRVVEV